MKTKVFMLLFLIGVMLFVGVSVFAESDLPDAVSVIEPPIVGNAGEIKLDNFGLFFELSKASDNELMLGVLSPDGEEIYLSAVNKITVVELGINMNKYTAISTNEYIFAENSIDSAYSKLNSFLKEIAPYIVSYTLDNMGNVETIYIPGGCSGVSERDTNFGRWMNANWNFNKDNTISTAAPAVEVAYKLYETPIIYGYSYDCDELIVSVIEKSQLQDGKEHNGYIYDKTEDNQVNMMLVRLPDEKYTSSVIDTITPVMKDGKYVYKITMYAKGIVKNGEPMVGAFINQNGTLVQYDITVTKYTESRSVIDNYKHKTIGTDYSNKIASEFYPGAAIYYKENDKGEISAIKKLYPLTSETGKLTDSEPYYKTEFFNTLPYKSWYTEGCECLVIYGKIADKRQYGFSNIRIDTMCTYNKGELPLKTLMSADYSKASIQIVDYSKESDEDKVYTGTVSDLKVGDYVLAIKKLGSTKTIVVYKNFNLEDYIGIFPVNSVELDKTVLDLNVGNTDVLKALVKPLNAFDKQVIWKSSDDNVVKVQDGVVTAVGEGTATITVTTAEGGKTSECVVTVGEKQQMSISDLTVGNGVKFSVNLSPSPKGRVVAALYNDGVFLEAKTVQLSQKKIDFEFSAGGDKVKIIWFDSSFRLYAEPIETDI